MSGIVWNFDKSCYSPSDIMKLSLWASIQKVPYSQKSICSKGIKTVQAKGIHSTVGSDCRFHESGSTKRIEKLEEESKGSEQKNAPNINSS